MWMRIRRLRRLRQLVLWHAQTLLYVYVALFCAAATAAADATFEEARFAAIQM